MITRVKFLALTVFMGSLAAASVAGAQSPGPFTVDATLADQGAKVWKSKSCETCHTIGKGKRAGPDLAGLTSRRSTDWLTQWLKDPPAMVGSDSVAKKMVKEFNGVIMANFNLTDPQVEGLIHYIAREDAKPKKK